MLFRIIYTLKTLIYVIAYNVCPMFNVLLG
jgi:hypothetical protein